MVSPKKVEEELDLKDIATKMHLLRLYFMFYQGKKPGRFLKIISKQRRLQELLRELYKYEIFMVSSSKYCRIPKWNQELYVDCCLREIAKLNEAIGRI